MLSFINSHPKNNSKMAAYQRCGSSRPTAGSSLWSPGQGPGPWPPAGAAQAGGRHRRHLGPKIGSLISISDHLLARFFVFLFFFLIALPCFVKISF